MTDPVTVATTDELAPGDGIAVAIDDVSVAVFNVDGEFFAIGNRCTHVGGSLGKGALAGTTVTCPLHGAKFDVTSGDVVYPPADDPVPSYEVVVEGDEIQVVL